MVRSATPRATGAVGVALKITGLSPNWPLLSNPHPQTVPSVITARLCEFALTELGVLPANPSAGIGPPLKLNVPFPSCPLLFDPHPPTQTVDPSWIVKRL